MAPIRTFVTMGAIVFNLLLLGALLLATPHLGVLRQLRLLAVGFLLQAGFHFLDIIITVSATYDAVVYQKSGLYVLANLVGGVGEQLFPIIIWALLTFRYWFSKPLPTSIDLLRRSAVSPRRRYVRPGS